MSNPNTILYIVFLIIALIGFDLLIYKRIAANKIWKNKTTKHLRKLLTAISAKMNCVGAVIETVDLLPICKIQKYQNRNSWGLNITAEEIENEELFNSLSLWNVQKIEKLLLDKNYNLVIDMGNNLEDSIEVIKIIISKKCKVNINNKVKLNFLLENRSANLPK